MTPRLWRHIWTMSEGMIVLMTGSEGTKAICAFSLGPVSSAG